MPTANVHQAKTHLSRLLDAAERGERVVITRRGAGVGRFALVPLPIPDRRGLFGALRGQVHLADDYEDADAEIVDIFETSAQSPLG